MGPYCEALKINKSVYKEFKKQMKRSEKCMKKKKYNRYIFEAEKSLQILKRSIGLNNPIAGRIYFSIGKVYNQLDQREKANEYLSDAKNIYEAFIIKYKDNSTYINDIKKSKKDLAIIYTILSDIALKLNDTRLLDEINTKLVDNEYVSTQDKIGALFQLAEFRKRAKHYDEAYDYGKQTIELLRYLRICNEHYYIQMYIILGLSALKMENYERAIIILKNLKENYSLQRSDSNNVQEYLNAAYAKKDESD
ncbi:tetratricopeptide repeat protein [Haloplasma contractile]|uniref:Tetratricopeptide repeat protein n=1 Tax=Haloplasma contractile SSD-17B TaxID=1033810 RepID=U2E862_9MOLU|nr:tetratricopeptide repeat protein [Haloplasma contractile]ERJ11066.1 hypothetical protein HLPCO_002887 [Haloplasma contractile SSD-17B]